jgi:hypothetical protein
MPRGILTKKTINMNHTFFLRTEIEGATADMTFNAASEETPENSRFLKELDNLLAQGEIIAYGYTTLMPY